jgi:hypothetical protein
VVVLGRQRRTLKRIEVSLRGDHLAAMFGLFARLAEGEEIPEIERVARPTAAAALRARSYALTVTAFVLAATLIPCLLVLSGHPGCTRLTAMRATGCEAHRWPAMRKPRLSLQGEIPAFRSKVWCYRHKADPCDLALPRPAGHHHSGPELAERRCDNASM